MKDIYSIIKRPHITEKATYLQEKANQVVFEVDPKANKLEIKEAVEKIFKVKVVAVNTIRQKGKVKRVGRSVGRRSMVKKAIVTLAPGEQIQIFEGV